jgi:hypothetical protein
MKLTGEALKNTVGNVAERFAAADLNTGFSPVAAAVAAPTSKPTPGFGLN